MLSLTLVLFLSVRFFPGIPQTGVHQCPLVRNVSVEVSKQRGESAIVVCKDYFTG